MAFFNSAVGVLQTLVVALGAGLGIWGAINLLEGYGNDNPGAKSQGMKQLMARRRRGHHRYHSGSPAFRALRLIRIQTACRGRKSGQAAQAACLHTYRIFQKRVCNEYGTENMGILSLTCSAFPLFIG